MNIKSCSLFVFFSVITGLASAGTLTIKSPPSGLELRTTSHILNHGDKDLERVGVSVVHEVVTPITVPDDIIRGHITLTHSEGMEGTYGNDVACKLKGPYELQIEFVGFKKFVCKNDDVREHFRQLRSEGSSDVILTFTKALKPKSQTD